MKLTVATWFSAILSIALAGCQPDAASTTQTAISFDTPDTLTPDAKQQHGKRLSHVLGCRGCHGPSLEGQKFDDDPKGYGVMWASNLTQTVPHLSDAQLEKLLRDGVHPDRAEMWVMPSEIFQHLSKPDMTALISYLRTLTKTGEPSPPPVLGPRAVSEIADGSIKPAHVLAEETRKVLPFDAGPKHAQGRYITSLTCAECHGTQLEGNISPDGNTPDLALVSAYSAQEFDHFITTGETPGKREIHELMVSVAKRRFSKLTPTERKGVYAYLVARAGRPQ